MQFETRVFTRYCTAALLALTMQTAAAAQAPQPSPQPPAAHGVEGEAEFTIFAGGKPVGREQIRLARSGTTWIITSTGTTGAGDRAATTRFEVKYSTDWHPIESRLEMTQGTRSLVIATSFGGTTAINEITQNGTTTAKTDQISARTIVLPNSVYAPYEALAARLATVEAGADVPVYVTPQTEIRMNVKSVTPERFRGPSGEIATRRYDVVFQNPNAPLAATVVIDDRARLVRVDIPGAGLSVVRSDLATVATRPQPVRNPTDADVIIPAAGFTLAGTLTTPPAQGRMRHPAVILVAGSGAVDRDETVAGIPIFAQLAGTLADKGFIVLRYDKRGVGQSGGRSERVTLQDYADDLVTAAKWMAKQENVDPRRIAVAGHSEGGWVGMLAASKEKKITSLVLIAAGATTGAELILEQQAHVLDVMKVSEAERKEKIDLQKRIQAAVISEQWAFIPDDVRKQADSPWFRSLLLFEPAKVMEKVKQPILIIQGGLDTQVPPHHADKLAELARARKKGPAVDVLHIPGVNHLLVKATTGEVSEYGSLPEKTIVPDVAARISDWLSNSQG
jgi:pimeloyl-ACP methyl ester carboxylesterase